MDDTKAVWPNVLRHSALGQLLHQARPSRAPWIALSDVDVAAEVLWRCRFGVAQLSSNPAPYADNRGKA
jgi:hypothetical protein